MVVDSSALVAIMLLEPEAHHFVRAIAESRRRLVSAANLLEAGIVIERRRGIEAGEDLDIFVGEIGLEIEPVTIAQVRIARTAYRNYGRGYHPAALNFGDCFAYALAKATGLPLLFKGNDFRRTDITAC